ncbi:MAG TPA: bifunctional 4-hydroxy-2-oxoglutarate aldolase/2-dehydro-3-deoxy-phosphogluconate aldolase [Candidatus Limnocylindria bacterium]|nr:bifunctional 4-hydroxy-2-oxoglutarate aldolase/2-dehydro-3-deoxy-phosphogluconate aldolase [Candidatus Limnocylindria bacterium]
MMDQLSMAGIIPVIKVDRAEDAVPLCRALYEGGLPVAEITFRTKAARESIRLVHEALPDVLLGAGTVLTAEQADQAWEAGARYIVSPGMNPAVVRHCLDKGYDVLPGCAGPSDIETAMGLGLEAVKFFPAEPLGGVKMLKALLGPYHEMKFVPTGGVSEQNLREYLAIPNVLACGGSWMVPGDAIDRGDWDKIRTLAAEAVKLLLGFEIVHIGFNHDSAEAAAETAKKLSLFTGWPVGNDSPNASFVGTAFEAMKRVGRGTHGHIAVGTASVRRARWHLERRGFTFDDTTLAVDGKGEPKLVYMDGEIGGFALHLMRR